MPITIYHLIDNKKLAELEGRTPLVKILDNSVLRESEKTYIKNLRDRLNRKKATRTFREKNKRDNQLLSEDIESLTNLKQNLLELRNNLISEIECYKLELWT